MLANACAHVCAHTHVCGGGRGSKARDNKRPNKMMIGNFVRQSCSIAKTMVSRVGVQFAFSNIMKLSLDRSMSHM